jgi:hypothetical protein
MIPPTHVLAVGIALLGILPFEERLRNTVSVITVVHVEI